MFNLRVRHSREQRRSSHPRCSSGTLLIPTTVPELSTWALMLPRLRGPRSCASSPIISLRGLSAKRRNQHADHQLWIDRRSAHLSVKRLQRLAEVIEGEMAVDAPEHVINRDVFLKAEIIEQPRRRSLKAHHRLSPANQRDSMNHDTALPAIKQPLFQRYPRIAVVHSTPSGKGVYSTLRTNAGRAEVTLHPGAIASAPRQSPVAGPPPAA
jgi:hypothetical protein